MFTLAIKTENAAFHEIDDNGASEVARILRRVAERVQAGERDGCCMDANGNNVGEWSFSEEV